MSLERAEMLDALTMRAINAHSGTTHAEAPMLLLGFRDSTDQVPAPGAAMQDICNDLGGSPFEWATRPEDRTRLWGPRHHANFAALQLRPASRAVSTDACEQLSALAQCVEETTVDIRDSGLVAPVFGHLGDGSFHSVHLVGLADPAAFQGADAMSARLVRSDIAMDGACTDERGVGLRKPALDSRCINRCQTVARACCKCRVMPKAPPAGAQPRSTARHQPEATAPPGQWAGVFSVSTGLQMQR